MFAVGRKIELPETGIYTDEKLLFHHVGTRHLAADEIARLQEFGIPYRVGASFKPSEDDQIRKNWEEFAAEHGQSPDAILSFSGSGETKGNMTFAEKQRQRQFLMETNFWPRMCHGLPHRSGNQVKRRILRIYDQAIVNGHATLQFGKRINVEWKELMEIVKMYKRTEDINLVAKEMKKPVELCRNVYDRFIEHNGRVFRQHWKALWNVVMRLTADAEDAHFKKHLRRAIREPDTVELGRLKGHIDFQKVGIAMSRNKKFCESAWDDMMEEWIREYGVEQRKTENQKVAWGAAQKKVFQEKTPVSVDNISVFLRLLAECVKAESEDHDYVPLKQKYVDLEKLSQLMIEHGITGFHVGGTPITELEYLFQKARTMLWRCEKFILSRLLFKYTLKERVSMMSQAFDSQIEAAIAEVENPDSAEGREHVNAILTKNSHAALKRNTFIETLVLFTLKLDPHWIPPSKFQKYVTNGEVLNHFPAHKDNSALIKHGQNKEMLKELAEWPIPDQPVEIGGGKQSEDELLDEDSD